MENDYLCPKCKSRLRIDNYVVLSVKKQSGERGIIFLSPKLGNYTYIKNSSLSFEKGERVDVFCPVCNKNLLCVPEKNLAKVFIKDSESGELLTVLFSVVFGEKATYKVEGTKKKAVESFGDDSVKHINFENLTLMC